MHTKCKHNNAFREYLFECILHFPLSRAKERQQPLIFFASVIFILSLLIGCGPSVEDLESVEYSPLLGDDWSVSTAKEQGLDPMLVAELYFNAAELETIHGLLVIKNGHLVAESYFNGGTIEQQDNRQSVTKGYTSALVGIALEQGCLSSIEQKMMDFFPEFTNQIDDPRMEQITIRDMLQMRSGYPSEETTPGYLDTLYNNRGNWLPLLVDFGLTNDPGTEFQYSNLTSHLLGVIVARACDTDLKSFGQEVLFSPINAEVGAWNRDADSYNYGHAEIFVTARDMAKFGLLYLKDGEHEGNQIISADWVHDSLQAYSEDAYNNVGQFRDIGYGYQWWSASAGEHQVNFAWGHGGQLIVIIDELEMVIVVTADPFYGVHGSQSWKHEKANINLVSKFISSLPSE